MQLEILKNGGAPQMAMASASFVRDDFVNGRRRYKGFLIQRAGGDNPVVIGEAQLEVPNLEIARILLTAMADFLSKQPVELLQVKAG
jgi:hypothetical protein